LGKFRPAWDWPFASWPWKLTVAAFPSRANWVGERRFALPCRFHPRRPLKTETGRRKLESPICPKGVIGYLPKMGVLSWAELPRRLRSNRPTLQKTLIISSLESRRVWAVLKVHFSSKLIEMLELIATHPLLYSFDNGREIARPVFENG
jgi:hypothetical protein